VKEQLESLVGMMVEKKFIKRVLEHSKGNQCRAAKILGIHRNTLSRKITEYHLDHNGRRR
jgi:DNA-binding protein Fis